MADYQRREVILPTRVELVLTAPTNATEISKALIAARQELEQGLRVYDDAITVESRDGEIVISFDKPGLG